jgi:hypothetical protein
MLSGPVRLSAQDVIAGRRRPQVRSLVLAARSDAISSIQCKALAALDAGIDRLAGIISDGSPGQAMRAFEVLHERVGLLVLGPAQPADQDQGEKSLTVESLVIALSQQQAADEPIGREFPPRLVAQGGDNGRRPTGDDTP